MQTPTTPPSHHPRHAEYLIAAQFLTCCRQHVPSFWVWLERVEQLEKEHALLAYAFQKYPHLHVL